VPSSCTEELHWISERDL